jgi:glycine/D-amino acid oxidase-like deaminating enzyme
VSPSASPYWERTSGPAPSPAAPLAGDLAVDVAVIGGGYTGLAAALRLATVHGVQVALLEANTAGWGASGRNSGFALISTGKLGVDERIRRWGLEAARRSIRLGVEAVETVRALIRDEAIGCEPQPDGWLVVAHRAGMVEELRARVRTYRDALGYGGVDFLDEQALAAGGYLRGPAARGAILFRTGFGLHPLKLARGLAAAAMRRGVRVFEGTRVLHWQRGPDGHCLSTPGGTLRAKRVVMATNGYTPERLHPFFRGRLLPAASNIVVTPPLTEDQWAATGMLATRVYSDSRKLVYYWRRMPDGRLLFGGRAGVRDTEASLRERRRALEEAIAAKWPVLRGVGSEHFWHGNVCLSYDLTPHVNTVEGDPTVAYAMAYLGSGVALATHGGGLAADLVMGAPVARDTPVTGAGLVRFPLPFLRRAYLAGAYLAYGLQDRGS